MHLQTKWRIASGVALACAAVMTWYGAEGELPRQSIGAFLLYWGICVLFLLIAVFLAIFDISYIRMRYAVEKRELARASLADKTLRKALKEGRADRRSDETEENQSEDDA